MNFKFTYSEIEELGGNLPMKKRKSRFTFDEVHLLLSEVKRNRHILVMQLSAFVTATGKFNQGASSDLRKRTWADIAICINKISECQREVMEIVKKWADLKCDAKRRMVAMRGPNGVRISQNMSPVEKMVHEILATSPPNKATMGSMNHEPEENDFGDMSEMLTRSSGTSNGMAGLHHMGMPGTSPHAMGSSMSPFSTQDKDIGMFSRMPFGRDPSQSSHDFSFMTPVDEDNSLGFEDLEEEPRHMGSFRPPAEPRRTYSRFATSSTAVSSSMATSSSSLPAPSSFLPAPPSSSTSPGSVMGQRAIRKQLAHSASLSLKEQQATTALLGAVSGSLGALAQSVQQLVESQQEFVRDSLEMQRETVSVLRDFSTNALALLRDKVNGHPPS
ncbi:zgc:113149-like isoform X2 [Salmo salar]|uniref:Zgc:113149-like isoform X2 n=1 Tax=Salmo salar TaxID=8030 RepID=A0A1S3SXW0_SALSA|nr:zgc:113149-like isoform X2 [Salmo salar]XP_045579196.1 zgc:113149-like isoform X2 [Salmo salar]XP_045579197.1 zgc:113149-like isoform X2 [Salmo salar]